METPRMERIERFKQYYDFQLDDFQLKAISKVEDGKSVIVSAPTSAGKTIIAEFAIDRSLEKGERVIYTTPLKALSNQKFRDFKKRFGERNIGIMTGDIVINREAPVLIMTTEIFRNMLYQDISSINGVGCAVLDEIHYITDEERGTVWEEVIISCPPEIQLVTLSASIESIERFARWVSSLKGKEMAVIENRKRPVPLTHYYFFQGEFYPFLKWGVIQQNETRKINNKVAMLQRKAPRGQFIKQYGNPKFAAQIELSLLRELQRNEMLPAIFFKFSRSGCDASAARARKRNLIQLDGDESTKILEFQEKFLKELSEDELRLRQTDQVFYLSRGGVGVHHAGLIPKSKEYIELLFTMGLLKVVFATETLALGINMPARTTVITAFSKYGGNEKHRILLPNEYIQLTGRAGRRGIDSSGNAVVPFEAWTKPLKVFEIAASPPDEITSSFRLSYNTVLNVIENHGFENALPFLKQSFAYYLAKLNRINIGEFDKTFHGIIKILRYFGYLLDGELTQKGYALRFLHGANELLISELIDSGLLDGLSAQEVCALLCTFAYDGDKKDSMEYHLPKSFRANIKITIDMTMKKIQKIERPVKTLTTGPNYGASGSIYLWSQGVGFAELANQSQLDEGDIIRSIRQTVEVIRQVHKYISSSDELRKKLEIALSLLYRDIIIVNI
jgi:superfamily II RNA helicase